MLKFIFSLGYKFKKNITYMIGDKFNYDDTFFRDLTVCLLDTLEGKVKWVNRFTSGDVNVDVPFYYSVTGDERFLLDSFSDDIVSQNRYVDLNTDIIPRAHITLNNFNIRSNEFRNPNVWLRTITENEKEIKSVLGKVRAVPITANYDLTILLKTEIDVYKCSQALMDTITFYKFMYFEYNYMNIDAIIHLPDNSDIEITREKNLSSDNSIKVKLSLEVQTYYPAFNFNKDKALCLARMECDPDKLISEVNSKLSMTQTEYNLMLDLLYRYVPQMCKYAKDNSLSCSHKLQLVNDLIDGRYNEAASFLSADKATIFYNQYSQHINKCSCDENDDNYIVPQRTRWFNNIIESRQQNRFGGRNIPD